VNTFWGGQATTQGPAGATGATGAAGPGPILTMLAADATSTTAAMAALGLSLPLTSGTRYAFAAAIMLDAGAALDGSAFDFDASTITASNVRYWWQQQAGLGGNFVTTLAGDIPGPAAGAESIWITGSVEPSLTGNFAMRFAQSAHTTETLIVYRGSWLMAWPA
jgi:hypothetical protein